MKKFDEFIYDTENIPTIPISTPAGNIQRMRMSIKLYLQPSFFEYNTKLFKKDTIDGLVNLYEKIISDVCENYNIMIGELGSNISWKGRIITMKSIVKLGPKIIGFSVYDY